MSVSIRQYFEDTRNLGLRTKELSTLHDEFDLFVSFSGWNAIRIGFGEIKYLIMIVTINQPSQANQINLY